MPMSFNDPPFELGETLKGTDSSGGLINSHWLGAIFEFPAGTRANTIRGNKARLSGKVIRAIALRNESGLTLYGKRTARLTRTAGYSLLESVDGYADTLLEKLCVLIDDRLATNGVADDDIFWGILAGPQLVLTPADDGTGFNGDIAVGAPLVAATAATTGTSDAGRVSNVTLPAQTGATAAFNAAANLIGYALSARTTGNTNSDLLINTCIRL